MPARSGTIAALVLIGLVAGSARAPAGDPPSQSTLTVSAAASLTAAFQALAADYERAHPTVHVQLDFGASSTLVQRILAGAPADVFASADETTMATLVGNGAAAETPRVFARNRLQIVVAAGNPKHIAALADLTRPDLVIALCGASVPCGRYAAEAFQRAGIVPPVASREIDVKGVVTKVALGEADAGLVYVTDVRAAAPKVEGVDVPDSSNVAARYPIAVLKDAANATAAASFVELVCSPDGRRVLAQFGFLTPENAPSSAR